jgi:anti-sigma B factor antagonist
MDIVVVEFEGGIDQFPRLIQTVDGLIADGERRLVIDLGTLPFINSAALGYLVKTQQTLNEMKGKLGLVRVQQAIRNILTVTHLMPLFSLHDSVDAAVKSLGGHPHDAAAVGAPAPQVKRKPLSAKH